MPPPPPIFTNPFPLVLSQEEEEELELALLERQSQFSTSPFDQPPNWVISNHSQDSQTSSLDQTIDIEFAFSFDKGRKSSLVVEEEEPETKPISTPSSSFQSTTTSLDSLEKFQDDPILPDTIENRRPVSLFSIVTKPNQETSSKLFDLKTNLDHETRSIVFSGRKSLGSENKGKEKGEIFRKGREEMNHGRQKRG